MLEVKDEIIDGNAKYNITPNDDGTFSIELATPVIQEGTPINKKLFNSIIENNIILSDLDDLEILSGTVSNAGAGWNSVTFNEAFSGIPEVVASAIGDTYKIEIKDVTSTGFLYRFVKYTIDTENSLSITKQTGYLITGMYNSGEASNWENNVTFVTGISSSADSSINEATVTDTSIKFSYIAVYNGKD